ncbi:MAG: GvpL/GvpF family gas vesicle protein, partial [Candidatus Rokuibacteriota bacterium]
MKQTGPQHVTYVYCLVRGATAPSVSKAPPGLPGIGRPRLLEASPKLWLAVADAPASRYSAARIERGLRDLSWVSPCAMAHEAVVEHFMGSRTVVPMKLFTLFK